MCQCDIRAEGQFNGWNDFSNFKAQIITSEFTEVPVKKPFSNSGFIDQWFQCNQCGDVWMLVEPDPPFRGKWSKVVD